AAIPHALQRLADGPLRGAAGVVLRGVEVVHPGIEGVPDEVVVVLPETARAEGDVGYLEARPPERATGTDPWRAGRLRVGSRQHGARRDPDADPQQRAATQELTAVDSVAHAIRLRAPAALSTERALSSRVTRRIARRTAESPRSHDERSRQLAGIDRGGEEPALDRITDVPHPLVGRGAMQGEVVEEEHVALLELG